MARLINIRQSRLHYYNEGPQPTGTQVYVTYDRQYVLGPGLIDSHLPPLKTTITRGFASDYFFPFR